MDGLEATFTRALAELGSRSEPAWLKSLRSDAFARFRALGLPSTKLEDWKYLSLTPLSAFELAYTKGSGPSNMGHYRGLALGASATLLFADGDFVPGSDSAPDSSEVGKLPKGVRVRSVSDVLRSGGRELQSLLDGYALDDGMKALNTALFRDGAFIEVDAGVRLEKPIHLIFSSTRGHLAPLRNFVLLGEGAELRLVEEYLGMGAALTTSVTQVRQARASAFKHLKLERESLQNAHFSDLRVHQARDSRFESLAILAGGALARNEIHTKLAEENAECRLLGLYAAMGKQQLDSFTVIDHASPNCRSHEIYKGVLAEEAKGAFTGRIVVRKDAQKTDSHQMNRNLLLSERAIANTRPQLQIHADDVKCAHGATVGRLDAEQLFYLRSRGIGLAAARRLVCRAFTGEVLDEGGWGEELASVIDRWLESLPGEDR